MTFVPIAVCFAIHSLWVLYGLWALWISSRAWHWFVRVMLLIGSTLPMLAIEAPDLIIMLLACQATIFFPVAIFSARKRQLNTSDEVESSLSRQTGAQSKRFKWNLSDMMLATAAIAAIIVLLNQDLTEQYVTLLEAVMHGCFIGASMLFAIALVFGTSSWKVRSAAVATTFVVAIVTDWIFSTPPTPASPLLSSSINLPFFSNNHEGFLFTIFMFTLGGLIVCRFSTNKHHKKRSRMQIAYQRFLSFMLLCVFVAMVVSNGYVFYRLTKRYPVNNAGMNEPNGYLELIEAGKILANSNILDTTMPMPPGKIVRNEVDNYQPQFDQIELALNRKHLNAFTWDKPKLSDLENNIERLQIIRNVARALCVKSRQELFDGNADIALNDGLNCMKLSLPLMRSGILMDALVGQAIENVAVEPVHNTIEFATQQELLKAMDTLENLNAQPFNPGEIVQKDHELYWTYCSWKYRLYMMIGEAIDFDTSDGIRDSFSRPEMIRNLLITEIALELHKRDRGRFPAELNELVPEFLPSLPLDLFPLNDVASPLKYEYDPESESYTLYSIGPNCVDDGGKLDRRGYWDETSGDINLSERYRIENEEAKTSVLPNLDQDE